MIDDEPIVMHIKGRPAPQGSKSHKGNGRMVESSRLLPAWRRAVKKASADAREQHGTIDRAVRVDVTVVLPRPKRSKFDGPAGAPDLDKLQRAIGDGLEAGGLISNDSRIVEWASRKVWAETVGGPTGAVVTVTLAEPVHTPTRWGLTA